MDDQKDRLHFIAMESYATELQLLSGALAFLSTCRVPAAVVISYPENPESPDSRLLLGEANKREVLASLVEAVRDVAFTITITEIHEGQDPREKSSRAGRRWRGGYMRAFSLLDHPLDETGKARCCAGCGSTGVKGNKLCPCW